jgi:hypothetical protein
MGALSRLAAVGVAASAIVAAGCGDKAAGPRSSQPATVHVRQEWVGGNLYIEGSYSYVRVEQGGKSVKQVRLSNERFPRATIRLQPGTYRLVSFQRPCDGNCSMLDPPTDQCSHEITFEADAELEALVSLSPGEGCTIAQGQKID